uniref:Uncharacterized protein n=1 Tax=Oryza glaberrima TaxID=4538 RepID=I1QS30_ORYGL
MDAEIRSGFKSQVEIESYHDGLELLGTLDLLELGLEATSSPLLLDAALFAFCTREAARTGIEAAAPPLTSSSRSRMQAAELPLAVETTSLQEKLDREGGGGEKEGGGGWGYRRRTTSPPPCTAEPPPSVAAATRRRTTSRHRTAAAATHR